MKRANFTSEQMAVLEDLARRHPDAHVRSRALAVRAVAHGHTREKVAEILPYSAYTIGQWVERFKDLGVEAFSIADGRGRRSRVNNEEVLDCLQVSPEHYGISQTHWTLSALEQACPSLKGMSKQGILNALHRLGFSYKRGHPWIHSPEPRDEEKEPEK